MKKSGKTIAVVVLFSLITAGVALAATSISIHDGPTWNDANDVYVTGVCSDTAYGETVCTQYTTDGSALQHTGNNPSSWNGDKAACSFKNSTTCEHYWLCNIPETANATINYQFYVVNQDAGGECSHNGNVYYGLTTGDASFQTGPNAVTVARTAVSSWGGLTVISGVLMLLGAGFYRRLR